MPRNLENDISFCLSVPETNKYQETLKRVLHKISDQHGNPVPVQILENIEYDSFFEQIDPQVKMVVITNLGNDPSRKLETINKLKTECPDIRWMYYSAHSLDLLKVSEIIIDPTVFLGTSETDEDLVTKIIDFAAHDGQPTTNPS